MPLTQLEMMKLFMLHGWTPYTREGKGSHIKMKKEGMSTNYHSTWRTKKRYGTQYIKTG